MKTPISISRQTGQGLKVTWPGGEEHEITAQTLRSNCPSATERVARNELDHDNPLFSNPKKPSGLRVVEHTIDEVYRIEKIWGIGNYAIGIQYGDGHKSGIYSYELLWELGETVAGDQPRK
jgi:DUF971 family protein